MAAHAEIPGDALPLPPPAAEVPADVAAKNEREIRRLLRESRPRRMSIIGLLLAIVLAGGAALATATVIAPRNGTGIADVVGPSKGSLAAQFQKGKAQGYATGILAGRAAERRAALKRARKQYQIGYGRGVKAGTTNGQRDGYTKGYQQAQGVYASAVASAQGQIATLAAQVKSLEDALKKAQAKPKPPGGGGTGGGSTTPGG